MGNKKDNVIKNKSFDFAIRIVNLYKFLCGEKNEFILSKQLLRCGTSIGANINEAAEAISKNEFKSKIYIALKEARETEYWLQLLYRTLYLKQDEYESINEDCIEIIKILVSISKSLSK